MYFEISPGNMNERKIKEKGEWEIKAMTGRVDYGDIVCVHTHVQ